MTTVQSSAPSSVLAFSSDEMHANETFVEGEWMPSGLNQKACLNQDIRAHAEQKVNWSHRDRVAYAHDVVEAMSFRFALGITKPPVIAIERKRINTLGTYRRETGAALENEISINVRYCNHGLGILAAVLLHEILHYRQYELGIETKGKDNGYHNAEFRKTATSLGIPCDQRGRFLGVIHGSPFHQFLLEEQARLGFPTGEMFHALQVIQVGEKGSPSPRASGTSKLKKWTCGCTNLWGAVSAVSARCLRCGNDFQQA